MNIIPKPNGALKQAEGTWQVRLSMKADLGGFSMDCLEAFSERALICFEAVTGNADFMLVRESDLKPEEYSLEVTPECIRIKASTEAGVIFALTTLYLSIDSGEAECFSLNDAPRYVHRGLMLDSVRHFFSAGEVKKIIEQISLAKVNKLHWHLSDDQGFRIEIKAYPALYEQIPYYTQEEIREIVRFAKVRGVEVIPEIDMPGHTASMVHVFPWLCCAGKQIKRPTSGGIYKAIMCAGKESTYEFIFKVLDEVADLFESPRIHIGGDEAPKIEWMECPECKKRLQEIGSDNFEELQGYFTSRIADYLKSIGKEVICWNETLGSDRLPEDLSIQYWMPGMGDEKVQKFFGAGRPVVFSDMFRLYLDYPHAIIPLKRVYDYVPSISGIQCEDAPNTLGLEVCLWSERVDTEEKLEEQIFPRVFALAEAAWTFKKDYDDFEQRLGGITEQLKQQGIHYTLPENYNPAGEEKAMVLQGIFASFAGTQGAAEEPDDNKVNLTELFSGEAAGVFLQGFDIDLTMLSNGG